MKYIILKWASVEVPVVFPDLLGHSTVAEGIKAKMNKDIPKDVTIISAGFCKFEIFSAKAFGESTSLKLKAREVEDSELLTNLMFDAPASSYLIL